MNTDKLPERKLGEARTTDNPASPPEAPRRDESMPDEFRLWTWEIELNAAGELVYRQIVHGQACSGKGERFSREGPHPSIGGQKCFVRWKRKGKPDDRRLPPT